MYGLFQDKIGRRVTLSLKLLPLAFLCGCSGNEAGQALEAVDWLRLADAACETKGGEMVAVHNKDADRHLEIWLDRWFMGVKTADRGRHELAPGGAPLQLGCSAADGGEQHWELVEARFVPR